MQVVAVATLAPGNCALCFTALGPFVDTRRTGPQGRVYVCRGCIRDLSAVLGEAQRTLPSVDRLAELEDELAALRGRFSELLAAVHLTLREGAVIRRGKIALRSQRGQPGFDLEL